MKQTLVRIGGWILALGAVLGFFAGALHPQGSSSPDFHATIARMLGSAQWPAAHWLAIIYALVATWALWLLLDGGWLAEFPVAWAGARLALVAQLFMAVQYAVELASRVELPLYASGQPASLVALVEPMQAAGWPALGIGYVLIALGARVSAPLPVRIAGALGGAAFAVGGIVVEGFHVVAAGPLFAAGGLAMIWLCWSGVKLGLGRYQVRPERSAGLSPA